jgi:hypothetical protein
MLAEGHPPNENGLRRQQARRILPCRKYAAPGWSFYTASAMKRRRSKCRAVAVEQGRRTMRQNHPSAIRLRSRFGATGLHQRDEFVAVMFELLVADAGDATKLGERRRV